MTVTPTQFVRTSVQANLNGVLPEDPIQYSCQQNFVILSTDGYWNGPNTYDLSNPPVNVGEQDGSDGARPKYDEPPGSRRLPPIIRALPDCVHFRLPASARPQITTQPQTTNLHHDHYQLAIARGLSTLPVAGPSGHRPRRRARFRRAEPEPEQPAVVSQTTTSSTTGGTSNTLADVAMYYYQTDLRTPHWTTATARLAGASTGIDVCPNNVRQHRRDNNTAQHMSTFTLGLGASGNMQYSPTYQTDTSGDYYSVANGVTAHPTATPPVCTWQSDGTICNWPVPVSGTSTTDRRSVACGGRRPRHLFQRDRSDRRWPRVSPARWRRSPRARFVAAAAATSTLNPVAGNNYAYVASYTTVKWTGQPRSAHHQRRTPAWSARPPSWCVENIVADTCAVAGHHRRRHQRLQHHLQLRDDQLDRVDLRVARGVRQQHEPVPVPDGERLHRHHARHDWRNQRHADHLHRQQHRHRA